MKNQVVKARDFLDLGLTAFAGLGMEIVLMFIEKSIGIDRIINSQLIQDVLHWIMTCIIWGVVTMVLIKKSRDKFNYSVFNDMNKPTKKGIILTIVLFIITILIGIALWNGQFKPIAEFYKKCSIYGSYGGVIAFIFQYIYYAFEAMLMVLIIAFGEKIGEIKFGKNKRIPYGGILLALTWGLVHILTKDLTTGIFGVIIAIVYGYTYLALNKNFKYSYITIMLMFML